MKGFIRLWQYNQLLVDPCYLGYLFTQISMIVSLLQIRTYDCPSAVELLAKYEHGRQVQPNLSTTIHKLCVSLQACVVNPRVTYKWRIHLLLYILYNRHKYDSYVTVAIHTFISVRSDLYPYIKCLCIYYQVTHISSGVCYGPASWDNSNDKLASLHAVRPKLHVDKSAVNHFMSKILNENGFFIQYGSTFEVLLNINLPHSIRHNGLYIGKILFLNYDPVHHRTQASPRGEECMPIWVSNQVIDAWTSENCWVLCQTRPDLGGHLHCARGNGTLSHLSQNQNGWKLPNWWRYIW